MRQLNNDERAQLRETVDTPGWKIIEEWIDSSDTAITTAIKRDLLKISWSERNKWFAYYSGEVAILENLRRFVKYNLNKPDVLAKIKEFTSRTY